MFLEYEDSSRQVGQHILMNLKEKIPHYVTISLGTKSEGKNLKKTNFIFICVFHLHNSQQGGSFPTREGPFPPRMVSFIGNTSGASIKVNEDLPNARRTSHKSSP